MSELSTVYSYGGGEAIYYIFNAIAMLFNNGFIKGIIDLSMALGLLWAGFKSGIQRDHHRPYVAWALACLFVITLVVPRQGGMTMHVRDVITGSGRSIDNLPPALVVPAAFISNLGYAVTKSFEVVFSLADKNYLPYHEYGTMFGAQTIVELQNFKIQDPVFRENMESYISNCIMYDVMIGKSYDIAELKSSPDIITLIADNASTLRMFNYRLPTKGRVLKTCKAGIQDLVASFNDEPPLLSKALPFLSTSASKNQNLGSGIIKALELSLNSYLSKTTEAQDKLKQILMINAFKDAPENYGVIRAAQSQSSIWRITGEMAKQTLPVMHALFQALIYGSFPIVICLVFFSGGMSLLGSYFGMMIWIELWGPLFAVLNLIVSVFARSLRIEDFTIHNLDKIISSQGNYVHLAASLGMLIPVLSYMIIRGGASQFAHIAHQLSGAVVSSASQATQEVISGNRSFDNVSLSNTSTNNTSSNKYDTTGQIQTAFMRSVLADGTIQTDFDTGRRIYQGGPGITSSVGDTAINEAQSFQANLHKQVQYSRSKIESETEELKIMEQQAYRQSVEYLARMAESHQKGEHFDISSTTEDNKSLSTMLENTKTLHDTYNYTWNQAADMTLKGSIDANAGINASSTISGGKTTLSSFNAGANASANAGAQGGAGVSASGSFKQEDTQGLGEDLKVSSSKNVNDNIATIERAAQGINYSESQNEEKNLATSLSEIQEKIRSQGKSISLHKSNQESAQKIIDESLQNSFNVSTNRYDAALKYIANKQDARGDYIGMSRARNIIERGGDELIAHLQGFHKRSREEDDLQEIQDFKENHNRIMKENNINFSNEKQKPEYEAEERMQQFKEEQMALYFANRNLDGAEIKNEIDDRKEGANEQIKEQAKLNQEAGNVIKKEVDEAEDNKGIINKALRLIGIDIGRENKNKGGKWDE